MLSDVVVVELDRYVIPLFFLSFVDMIAQTKKKMNTVRETLLDLME